MYLGIDVGGTKTLVTALDGHGVIKEKIKFPTPHHYPEFLEELKNTINQLETKDFAAGGIGVPGTLNRKHGVGLHFSNLPWKNVHILHDVERLVNCPMVLENDAKMAALSEAMLLKHEYDRVLYITVSTGIGIGLVVDGVIDSNLGDEGGRAMILPYKGKLTPWEDFAGGRAIVARYGKRGEDIHDEETWSKISRDLAPGIIQIVAMVLPEVIVFGGSVGVWFDRYGKLLKDELHKYELPTITMPKLVQAQRPEEAVVYGCYDLAKQTFPHASTTK